MKSAVFASAILAAGASAIALKGSDLVLFDGDYACEADDSCTLTGELDDSWVWEESAWHSFGSWMDSLPEWNKEYITGVANEFVKTAPHCEALAEQMLEFIDFTLLNGDWSCMCTDDLAELNFDGTWQHLEFTLEPTDSEKQGVYIGCGREDWMSL